MILFLWVTRFRSDCVLQIYGNSGAEPGSRDLWSSFSTILSMASSEPSRYASDFTAVLAVSLSSGRNLNVMLTCGGVVGDPG